MSEIVLIEDKANRLNYHTIKNKYWQEQGIEVMRYALPVGDYILANDKVFDMLARKKARGLEPKKMDFLGCYKVCVDSKRNVEEILGNVCGKAHARFKDELLLAKQNDIQLYILVENKQKEIKPGIVNPTIRRLEDLHRWINPRLYIYRGGKQLYPSATRGITLQKACYTMQKKYGCEFVFCTPEESGEMIIKLLKGEQP